MVERSLDKGTSFYNANWMRGVFWAFNLLHLLTRGRRELTWAFPSGLARDQVRVEDSRCGRTSQQYCSSVTVSRSQAQHTGLFRCRYRHRTRRQTSIYVYVTGKKTLLPEIQEYDSHFFSFLSSCLALSHSSRSPTLLHPLMLIVYILRLNRMRWVLNTDQCQRANYI